MLKAARLVAEKGDEAKGGGTVDMLKAMRRDAPTKFMEQLAMLERQYMVSCSRLPVASSQSKPTTAGASAAAQHNRQPATKPKGVWPYEDEPSQLSMQLARDMLESIREQSESVP